MADDQDQALAEGNDNGNGNNTDEVADRTEEPSPLRKMMSQYYMEYASYVIRERAIPHIDDGLKPVQRRILHALYEMDDGKFHKVANVVGDTMKYHPHGDTSISDALVNLANKEYFIEKQGNFGNIFTGDIAAASRYIECRLSPLAREVMFNREITTFSDSYDGRRTEPQTLPTKVPVLLLQGAEGIAVGMSTRIMPHNFNEVLEAQIKHLQGKKFKLYPDFLQGASMDASEYDDGNGRIRLRATIDAVTDKKLIIREIPPTSTTESLIASIEDAAHKGKIKISSITDYTSDVVEIEINLPRNVYAEQTIKALYAYTKCEDTLSCNFLVIRDNRPVEMSISECLEFATDKLMNDLRRELEIELGKLHDQFHAKTLAQIFIENRIYKRIEEAETYELVLSEVRKGLEKFRDQLRRDISDEDIEKLLQIPIRRISLFDINKNRRDIEDILSKIEEVNENLADIRNFTIRYIKQLQLKYGSLYPRRTRIEEHETVDKRKIALTNLKVGHDRSGGYIGTSVKSDDPIVCTEYDRLLIIGWDGSYKVVPVPDKLYVGAVCAVYKADKDQVYSMVYREKKSRTCYAKRFRVDSYIMDKDYRGAPKGSKIEKLFDRYGVVLRCEFEPKPRQRVDHCELDFEEVPIRGSKAKGIKVHSNNIVKFLQLKRGSETPPDELAPEDDEGLSLDELENEVESAPQPDDESPAVAPASLNIATLQHEAIREAEAKLKKKQSRRKKKGSASKTSASDKKGDDKSQDDGEEFELY